MSGSAYGIGITFATMIAAMLAVRHLWSLKPIGDLHFCAAGFAVALSSLGLMWVVFPANSPLYFVALIGGSASCGWAFLMLRALCRPAAPSPVRGWPLTFVLLIAGLHMVAVMVEFAGAAEPARLLFNLLNVMSSTVLLLAAVEPFLAIQKPWPRAEKRFRIALLAGNSTLSVIAVLWLREAPEGTIGALYGDEFRLTLAFIATLGGLSAIAYRLRNPVPALPEPAPAPKAPPTPEVAALAPRLRALFSDESFITQSPLKVGDVATRLGEPDYKVSQCITGALGFANFNRCINHYRVERAKRLLADPAHDDSSVLMIALDSGFGSIGPFNRAFKDAEGVTPRAYRLAARSGDALAATPAE